MAQVQLKKVTKSFGRQRIIHDISLDIRDREFFVMVGPSGCGKSTILRLIAGLESVSEGEIFINKTLVNDVPPKDRNIAMVFQNYAIYPHMTLYENMAFGLNMRGFSQKEIQSRVNDAAESLGILPLLNRKPDQVSGGQLQRVAVGRAIVRKPKVFLFDEPLSNLDAKLRVQTRTEILELHKRLQATMIYVTHDQVEAMTMGDRLCVVRDGTVQQIDRPLDLYRYPANRFVAEFIGSPSMNFFDMSVVEKEGSFWLDQGHFQLKLPRRYKLGCPLAHQQKVLMGIRPDDIQDRLYQKGAVEDGNNVVGIVQLTEPIGSAAVVHVTTGGTRFMAMVDANAPVQLNQPIELIFNMENVHLFTEDGEQRLSLEV